MSKLEWFEAWLRVRSEDVTIHHRETGIAWAGFWIGLGLVLAAAIMKGELILK